MAAIKLEQSDAAQHEAGMMQRLRTQGRRCDVAVKSRDGTEHRVHSVVLCAASSFFDSLLGGSFLEADQMQQGRPVEIAASDAAVSALLDYIYGGQPEVPVEDSLELLRLADAYDLPGLVAATETGLQTFLAGKTADMDTALKILQQTQGLYALKATCEQKVASNFMACVKHPGFLKLGGGQLGRLLERSDLKVTREEEVLKGLIQWFKESADRGHAFAALLRHVDFPSISLENLARIGSFASSMGPHGDDLQREVDEASLAKKRSLCEAPEVHRPKRRCFKHWSAYSGASRSSSGRKVLLDDLVRSLSWHDGAIYAGGERRILRWKPGDTEPQVVAGRGARRVAGINNVSDFCCVSVAPDGRLFVADVGNNRLLCFQDGSGQLSGQLVLDDVDLKAVVCSPNGAVYVLDHRGTAVQKLVGSTLETVIDSANLPKNLKFTAGCLFVTREEAIYVYDRKDGRILRISTGETRPVVLGRVPESGRPNIFSASALFATDDGKVFIADAGQNKVWALCPPFTTCSEVLKHDMKPIAVVVHDQSLYVALCDIEDSDISDDDYDDKEGIYEYSLPPELQL